MNRPPPFAPTAEPYAGARPTGEAPDRPGVRLIVDVDGRELAVVSRLDAVDLYVHTPRVGAVVFAVPERALRRLLWWLVWRWLVRETWLGLRTALARRRARRAVRAKG